MKKKMKEKEIIKHFIDLNGQMDFLSNQVFLFSLFQDEST